MATIFEFTCWALCLTGAAMAYASFHYFMQRRIADPPPIKRHNELMMAFCFFMVVSIALLISIPHIYKILP